MKRTCVAYSPDKGPKVCFCGKAKENHEKFRDEPWTIKANTEISESGLEVVKPVKLTKLPSTFCSMHHSKMLKMLKNVINVHVVCIGSDNQSFAG